MDIPEGYRAGFIGEKVEKGKGWERLEDDGGGEAWMQLGETCEPYTLTEKEMKHRIKVNGPVLIERRKEDRRKGGDGQEGGNHYESKVDPWELQREMKSSGDAFVDARRADAIKYAWRMKGDKKKLLEDLKKARHCIDAAITQLQNAHE